MAAKRKSGGNMREVFTTLIQLVFGLMGGALLCGVWLALKPVTIMDELPKDDRVATDRHEVIYIRGKAALRGAQGARKQKAFLDQTPGEHVFVEEDVNRWLATVYGPLEREAKLDAVGLTLTIQLPIARMVGNEMEIAAEMVAERGETKRVIVAYARGRFVARSGHPVFVPRQVYLGSCPLPWNLGGRLVYEKLQAMYPVEENVASAWSGVQSATVSESRLHLVVGQVAAVPAPAPVAVPEVVAPAAPAEPTPAAVTVEEPPVSPESAPATPDTAATIPEVDPAATIPESIPTSVAEEPAAPVEVPAVPADEPAPAAAEPAPADMPAPVDDSVPPPAVP